MYDGKKIYEYGKVTQPWYEIRGIYIYCTEQAIQPSYDLVGNYIYRHGLLSSPIYEIKKQKYIYFYKGKKQPLFEIK